MSAVLTEREHMTGLDRSYVNAKLNAWGHWMERHAEVNGYPHQDNVTAFMAGAGGGTKGHRVLCLDMPEPIGLTHIRVLSLSENEQRAVFIWYVVRLKDDGSVWTIDEKCKAVGIKPQTLRLHLSRAKYRFLGLVPPS